MRKGRLTIFEELRNRFTTWETVLGGLWIGVSWLTWSYPEYLIRPGLSIFALVAGLYYLFTNEYRRRAKEDELAEAYRKQ